MNSKKCASIPTDEKLLADYIESAAFNVVTLTRIYSTYRYERENDENCTMSDQEIADGLYQAFDDAYNAFCNFMYMTRNMQNVANVAQSINIVIHLNYEYEFLNEQSLLSMYKTGEVPPHFFCP